jgi:hypothetical protein
MKISWGDWSRRPSTGIVRISVGPLPAAYDVPAVPDISEVAPAAMVSRVAERALGDQIGIAPRASVVDFAAAGTSAGRA